jgi:hypothetical protein
MTDITLSTGNAVGPPAGTVLRAETISAKQYQVVKVALGAADAFNADLEGTNDLTALLASAARTAAGTSADQTSASHKGVLLFLNVTVEAGVAKTLSLAIQGKDPISGNYVTLYDFGVVDTHATGTFACILYPGLLDADLATAAFGKSGNLPHVWRAVVTPSDSTSWTYSLGASGLF